MSDAGLIYLADPPRKCGSCTLCCTMIPVPEIGKSRGVRCKFVRHGKGCSIYARRPRSCSQWSCRWLMQPDLLPGGWLRPDHSRVIFDPMPDHITHIDNTTGERRDIDVQQLWVDPIFPDAHRDPRVRRVIERFAKQSGIPTIARIGLRGLVIYAPCLAEDGRWHEVEAGLDPKRMPEDPTIPANYLATERR